MRIIGIDYGERRVGVALSDETGGYAFPHSVIEAPYAEEKIALLAQAEGSSLIVLGESRDFGGRKNAVMEKIERLRKGLERRGFEVVLEEEYFSSVEAERFQGRREDSDASAAAIILQRFLDKRQQKPL